VGKIKQFVNEVIEQLHQVTWPDKETLVELTVVVILFSIVVGTVLVGADFLFTKLIGFLTVK
jgi:preprotein translocase SecE subunit